MIAYKFLAAGGRGPLSRVAWPAVGDWLVTDGPIVGKRGAHVCTEDQLAHWLHDELWQVELAGPHLAGPDCLVAERARLVHRVAAWNADGAMRFARACLDHARALAADPALLADAESVLGDGYPAVAAYTAAIATARDDEAVYARERAWQSAWIVREIISRPADLSL